MSTCVFATLMTALLPGSAAANDVTARQIADQVLAKNSFGFQNAVARVTLTLTGKSGSERQRQIEIRSLDEEGLSRTLVRFFSPADVAGTGFLVRENQDREDDQYLYLPALGKVKRITSSQRRQRFMGTDLTYADLESRSLRRARLSRGPDADIGGNPAYLLEATPEKDSDSHYSKTITWVHKASFVPLRVEFYGDQGELLKVLRARRLEKRSGRWVVTDSVVKNEEQGTQTRMLVEAIDFDVRLSAAEFSQRALAGG